MTSVMPTVVRVGVTLLAIGGTAGQVAYLDALWWHALGLSDTLVRDVNPALLPVFTAHAFVSIVCAALAVALALHEGPRERAARALGAAFGAWTYLMAYAGLTVLGPDAGTARDLFEAHFLLVEMLGLAGLVRFTALFPNPLDGADIVPGEDLPAILIPAHHVSVWMLRPWAPWATLGAVLAALWGTAAFSGNPLGDAGLSPYMYPVRVAAVGLAVLNLWRSWGRAAGEARARMHWLVVALASVLGVVAMLIGGNVLVAVTGFPEPHMPWRPLLLDVGMLGFLGGLGFSVLDDGDRAAWATAHRIGSSCAIVTLGLFLAAGLEALLAGGLIPAFTLRGGVGSALALATVLSTYRGMSRMIERVVPRA